MDNEELHQLKRDLYHWAKETLRGISVINTDSGNVIEITSQGIDEWYSNNRRIYYHHYLEGLKSKTVLNSSAPTQEGK